jgi:hypothetical protein
MVVGMVDVVWRLIDQPRWLWNSHLTPKSGDLKEGKYFCLPFFDAIR